MAILFESGPRKAEKMPINAAKLRKYAARNIMR